MRKIFSVIAVAVATCTLLSCEKEYTCSCKEIDTTTGKMTKNWNPMKGTYTRTDAEKWCHGNETSGFGIRIECSLK